MSPNSESPLKDSSRALTRKRKALPVSKNIKFSAQIVPLAQRSLIAVGTALAAEYAIRTAFDSILRRILTPIRSTPTAIRTEITEWTIVERVRRR